MTNKTVKMCMDYMEKISIRNGLTIVEWHITDKSLVFKHQLQNGSLTKWIVPLYEVEEGVK